MSINDVILMSILALTALNCISDRNKNTDNASRTVEILESNEQMLFSDQEFSLYPHTHIAHIHKLGIQTFKPFFKK